ncbi:unnamed protein product [Camellia sinensis]
MHLLLLLLAFSIGRSRRGGHSQSNYLKTLAMDGRTVITLKPIALRWLGRQMSGEQAIELGCPLRRSRKWLFQRLLRKCGIFVEVDSLRTAGLISACGYSKLCCATVKSLFINEGKHGGEAIVEAVQLIAEHVKAYDCQLHPDSIESV